MKRTLKMILIAIAVFVCLLFFNQHRLIWLPRSYTTEQQNDLPKNAVVLDYTTSQGHQRAYYIPPSAPGVTAPARIWVLFCGNGSLALDWLDFLLMAPEKKDGFLLFDYPGYGWCEGSATPATIKDSSEAAFARLCMHLGYAQWNPSIKVNILAHSIGCAAGLEFATRHPAGDIILLSPFTTLRDMARRTVGWPLCWLLRHNFDNRARLAELATRPAPPHVTIFHGTTDTLIPIQMGRTLAAAFPKMITFHEVPGAGHNDIVEYAEPQIYAAMKN